MGCERVDTLLHGYFDNELDADSAAEFERHLERCSECSEGLEALKTLRSSMNAANLYERAPASLRKRVVTKVQKARPAEIVAARKAWQWLAVAAAFVLLAYAAWRGISVYRGDSQDKELAAEVVDAHLRSLQPGHLTDVVSTDQHTVKPWFDGKLAFAPPVRDFAGEGFSLQGGRLDIVHGRTTAALVYGRRKHLVNVFIWPTSEVDESPRKGSSQGYQWIEWRKGGMEFWVVSDAAFSDLEQLQRLFAE